MRLGDKSTGILALILWLGLSSFMSFMPMIMGGAPPEPGATELTIPQRFMVVGMDFAGLPQWVTIWMGWQHFVFCRRSFIRHLGERGAALRYWVDRQPCDYVWHSRDRTHGNRLAQTGVAHSLVVDPRLCDVIEKLVINAEKYRLLGLGDFGDRSNDLLAGV